MIVVLFCVPGIGNGCVLLSATVILQQYFDKRRPLALGLGVSGMSVGGMSSAVLVNALLERYGLSGALIMSSGIWLHTAVGSCLYRPVHLNRSVRRTNTGLASRLDHVRSDATDSNVECKMECHDEWHYSDGRIKESSKQMHSAIAKPVHDEAQTLFGTEHFKNHDIPVEVEDISRSVTKPGFDTSDDYIDEKCSSHRRTECACTSAHTEHQDLSATASVPIQSLCDTESLEETVVHQGHDSATTESDNNESDGTTYPPPVSNGCVYTDDMLDRTPCTRDDKNDPPPVSNSYVDIESGSERHDVHGNVREISSNSNNSKNSCTLEDTHHNPPQDPPQGMSSLTISPELEVMLPTLHAQSKTSNHGQSVRQTFLIDLFDFRMLKNIPFSLFLIGSFCINMTLMGVFSHFISKMIHMGVDRQTAIIVQTVMAGCVIPGRYLASAVANIKNIDRLIMHGTAVTVTSILVTSIPVAKSFGALMVYAILHGLGCGKKCGITQSDIFIIVSSESNLKCSYSTFDKSI